MARIAPRHFSALLSEYQFSPGEWDMVANFILSFKQYVSKKHELGGLDKDF